MPTNAITREGTCATADLFTKLTGDGAGGTLDDATIGTGMKSIKRLTVSLGLDGAAACDNNVIIRLKGTALVNGEQNFAVAGTGAEGTPVTYAADILSCDVDVPIKDGGDLQVFSCMAGASSGTPEVCVGLVLSDKPGAAHYEVRECAAGTADTWATAKGDGTAVAVNEMKSTGSRISEVWHCVGPSSTTQEPFHTQMRITGLQGAFKQPADSEHTFAGPSYGAADGTVTHSTILRALIHKVDIPIAKGGKTVRIEFLSAGAAVTGTPQHAATVVFV